MPKFALWKISEDNNPDEMLPTNEPAPVQDQKAPGDVSKPKSKKKSVTPDVRPPSVRKTVSPTPESTPTDSSTVDDQTVAPVSGEDELDVLPNYVDQQAVDSTYSSSSSSVYVVRDGRYINLNSRPLIMNNNRGSVAFFKAEHSLAVGRGESGAMGTKSDSELAKEMVREGMEAEVSNEVAYWVTAAKIFFDKDVDEDIVDRDDRAHEAWSLCRVKAREIAGRLIDTPQLREMVDIARAAASKRTADASNRVDKLFRALISDREIYEVVSGASSKAIAEGGDQLVAELLDKYKDRVTSTYRIGVLGRATSKLSATNIERVSIGPEVTVAAKSDSQPDDLESLVVGSGKKKIALNEFYNHLELYDVYRVDEDGVVESVEPNILFGSEKRSASAIKYAVTNDAGELVSYQDVGVMESVAPIPTKTDSEDDVGEYYLVNASVNASVVDPAVAKEDAEEIKKRDAEFMGYRRGETTALRRPMGATRVGGGTASVKQYVLRLYRKDEAYDSIKLFDVSGVGTRIDYAKYPYVILDSGMTPINNTREAISDVYKKYDTFEDAANAAREPIDAMYTKEELIQPHEVFYMVKKGGISNPFSAEGVRSVENPKTGGYTDKAIRLPMKEREVKVVSTIPRYLAEVNADTHKYEIRTDKTSRSARPLWLTADRAEHAMSVAVITERLGIGYVPLVYENSVVISRTEGGQQVQVFYKNDAGKKTLAGTYPNVTVATEAAKKYGLTLSPEPTGGAMMGQIVKMSEWSLDEDGFSNHIDDFMAILPDYEGTQYIEIPKSISPHCVISGSYGQAKKSLTLNMFFSPKGRDRKKYEDLDDSLGVLSERGDRAEAIKIKGEMNRIIDKKWNERSGDLVNPSEKISSILEDTSGPVVKDMSDEERNKLSVLSIGPVYVAEYLDGSSHRLLSRIVQVPVLSIDDFGVYLSGRAPKGQASAVRQPGDVFLAQEVTSEEGDTDSDEVKPCPECGAENKGSAEECEKCKKEFPDSSVFTFNIYSFARSGLTGALIDTVRTVRKASADEVYIPVGSTEARMQTYVREGSDEDIAPDFISGYGVKHFEAGKRFGGVPLSSSMPLKIALSKMLDKYSQTKEYKYLLSGLSDASRTGAINSAMRNIFTIVSRLNTGADKSLAKKYGSMDLAVLAERVVNSMISMDPEDRVDGTPYIVKNLVPVLFGFKSPGGGEGDKMEDLDYRRSDPGSKSREMYDTLKAVVSKESATAVEKMANEKAVNSKKNIVETPFFIAKNGVLIDGHRPIYVGTGSEFIGPMIPYKLESGSGNKYYLVQKSTVIRCSPDIFGDKGPVDAGVPLLGSGDIWERAFIKSAKMSVLGSASEYAERAAGMAGKSTEAVETLRKRIKELSGDTDTQTGLLQVMSNDLKDLATLNAEAKGPDTDVDKLEDLASRRDALVEKMNGQIYGGENEFLSKAARDYVEGKTSSRRALNEKRRQEGKSELPVRDIFREANDVEVIYGTAIREINEVLHKLRFDLRIAVENMDAAEGVAGAYTGGEAKKYAVELAILKSERGARLVYGLLPVTGDYSPLYRKGAHSPDDISDVSADGIQSIEWVTSTGEVVKFDIASSSQAIADALRSKIHGAAGTRKTYSEDSMETLKEISGTIIKRDAGASLSSGFGSAIIINNGGKLVDNEKLRALARVAYLDGETSLAKDLVIYLDTLQHTSQSKFQRIRTAAMLTAWSDEWNLTTIARVVAEFAMKNADVLGNIVDPDTRASSINVDTPSASSIRFDNRTAAKVCDLFVSLRQEYRNSDGALPLVKQFAEQSIRRGFEVMEGVPDLMSRVRARYEGQYDFTEDKVPEDLIRVITDSFIGAWLDYRRNGNAHRRLYTEVADKDRFDKESDTHKNRNIFGIFDMSPIEISDALFGSDSFDKVALGFLMGLMGNKVMRAAIQKNQDKYDRLTEADAFTRYDIDPFLTPEITKAIIVQTLGSFAMAIVNRFDRELAVITDCYYGHLGDKYNQELIAGRKDPVEFAASGKAELLAKSVAARPENMEIAFHAAFEKYKTIFDVASAQSKGVVNPITFANINGAGYAFAKDPDAQFFMNLLQCLTSDHNFAFNITLDEFDNDESLSPIAKAVKSAIAGNDRYSYMLEPTDAAVAALNSAARGIYIKMLSDSVSKQADTGAKSPVDDPEAFGGYVKDIVESGKLDDVSALSSGGLVVTAAGDDFGSVPQMSLMSVLPKKKISFKTEDQFKEAFAENPPDEMTLAIVGSGDAADSLLFSGGSWQAVDLDGDRVVLDSRIVSDLNIIAPNRFMKWNDHFSRVLGMMNHAYNYEDMETLADHIQGVVDDDPSLRRQNMLYDAGLAGKLSSVVQQIANYRLGSGSAVQEAEVRSFDKVDQSTTLLQSFAALRELWRSGELAYGEDEKSEKRLQEFKAKYETTPVQDVFMDGKEQGDLMLPQTFLQVLDMDTVKKVGEFFSGAKDAGWTRGRGVVGYDIHARLMAEVNKIKDSRELTPDEKASKISKILSSGTTAEGRGAEARSKTLAKENRVRRSPDFLKEINFIAMTPEMAAAIKPLAEALGLHGTKNTSVSLGSALLADTDDSTAEEAAHEFARSVYRNALTEHAKKQLGISSEEAFVSAVLSTEVKTDGYSQQVISGVLEAFIKTLLGGVSEIPKELAPSIGALISPDKINDLSRVDMVSIAARAGSIAGASRLNDLLSPAALTNSFNTRARRAIALVRKSERAISEIKLRSKYTESLLGRDIEREKSRVRAEASRFVDSILSEQISAALAAEATTESTSGGVMLDTERETELHRGGKLDSLMASAKNTDAYAATIDMLCEDSPDGKATGISGKIKALQLERESADPDRIEEIDDEIIGLEREIDRLNKPMSTQVRSNILAMLSAVKEWNVYVRLKTEKQTGKGYAPATERGPDGEGYAPSPGLVSNKLVVDVTPFVDTVSASRQTIQTLMEAQASKGAGHAMRIRSVGKPRTIEDHMALIGDDKPFIDELQNALRKFPADPRMVSEIMDRKFPPAVDASGKRKTWLDRMTDSESGIFKRYRVPVQESMKGVSIAGLHCSADLAGYTSGMDMDTFRLQTDHAMDSLRGLLDKIVQELKAGNGSGIFDPETIKEIDAIYGVLSSLRAKRASKKMSADSGVSPEDAIERVKSSTDPKSMEQKSEAEINALRNPAISGFFRDTIERAIEEPFEEPFGEKAIETHEQALVNVENRINSLVSEIDGAKEGIKNKQEALKASTDSGASALLEQEIAALKKRMSVAEQGVLEARAEASRLEKRIDKSELKKHKDRMKMMDSQIESVKREIADLHDAIQGSPAKNAKAKAEMASLEQKISEIDGEIKDIEEKSGAGKDKKIRSLQLERSEVVGKLTELVKEFTAEDKPAPKPRIKEIDDKLKLLKKRHKELSGTTGDEGYKSRLTVLMRDLDDEIGVLEKERTELSRPVKESPYDSKINKILLLNNKLRSLNDSKAVQQEYFKISRKPPDDPSAIEELRQSSLAKALAEYADDAFDRIFRGINCGISPVLSTTRDNSISAYATAISKLKATMLDDSGEDTVIRKEFLDWIKKNHSEPAPSAAKDDKGQGNVEADPGAEARIERYTKVGIRKSALHLFEAWMERDDLKAIFKMIFDGEIGKSQIFEDKFNAQLTDNYLMKLKEGGETTLGHDDTKKLYEQISKLAQEDLRKFKEAKSYAQSLSAPGIGTGVEISDARISIGAVDGSAIVSAKDASEPPHAGRGQRSFNTDNYRDDLGRSGILVDKYRAKAGEYCVVRISRAKEATDVYAIPAIMIFTSQRVVPISPETVAGTEFLAKVFNENNEDGKVVSVSDITHTWIKDNEIALSRMAGSKRGEVVRVIKYLKETDDIVSDSSAKIEEYVKRGVATPDIILSGVKQLLKGKNVREADISTVDKKMTTKRQPYVFKPISSKTTRWERGVRRNVAGANIDKTLDFADAVVNKIPLTYEPGGDRTVSAVGNEVRYTWMESQIGKAASILRQKSIDDVVPPLKDDSSVKPYNDAVVASVKSGTATVLRADSSALGRLNTMAELMFRSEDQKFQFVGQHIKSSALAHPEMFTRVRIEDNETPAFFVTSPEGLPLVDDAGKIKPLSLIDLWVLFGVSGAGKATKVSGISKFFDCLSRGGVELGPRLYKKTIHGVQRPVILQEIYYLDEDLHKVPIQNTVYEGVATGGSRMSLSDDNAKEIRYGKKTAREVSLLAESCSRVPGLTIEVRRSTDQGNTAWDWVEGEVVLRTSVTAVKVFTLSFASQGEASVRPGDKYRVTSNYKIESAPKGSGGGFGKDYVEKKELGNIEGSSATFKRLMSALEAAKAGVFKRDVMSKLIKAFGSKNPGQGLRDINRLISEGMKADKRARFRAEAYKQDGAFLYNTMALLADAKSQLSVADKAISGKLVSPNGFKEINKISSIKSGTGADAEPLFSVGEREIFTAQMVKAFLSGEGGEYLDEEIKAYVGMSVRVALLESKKTLDDLVRKANSSKMIQPIVEKIEGLKNAIKANPNQEKIEELRDELRAAQVQRIRLLKTHTKEVGGMLGKSRGAPVSYDEISAATEKYDDLMSVFGRQFADRLEKDASAPEEYKKTIDSLEENIGVQESESEILESALKSLEQVGEMDTVLESTLRSKRRALTDMRLELSIKRNYYAIISRYKDDSDSIDDNMESIAMSFASLSPEEMQKMSEMKELLGGQYFPERLSLAEGVTGAIKKKVVENICANILMRDRSSVINGRGLVSNKRTGKKLADESQMGAYSSMEDVDLKNSDLFKLCQLWVYYMKDGDEKVKTRLRQIYVNFLVEEAKYIVEWYETVFVKIMNAHKISVEAVKELHKEKIPVLHVDAEALRKNAENIAELLLSEKDIGSNKFIDGVSGAYFILPLQNPDMLKMLMAPSGSGADRLPLVSVSQGLKTFLGLDDVEYSILERDLMTGFKYHVFDKTLFSDRNQRKAATAKLYTGTAEAERRMQAQNMKAEEEGLDTGPAGARPSGPEIKTSMVESARSKFSALMSARRMRLGEGSLPSRPFRLALGGKDVGEDSMKYICECQAKPAGLGACRCAGNKRPVVPAGTRGGKKICSLCGCASLSENRSGVNEEAGSPTTFDAPVGSGLGMQTPGTIGNEDPVHISFNGGLCLMKDAAKEIYGLKMMMLKIAAFENGPVTSEKFSKMKSQWAKEVIALPDLKDVSDKDRKHLADVLFNDFVEFVYSKDNLHKTPDDLRALLKRIVVVETAKGAFLDIANVPGGFVEGFFSSDSPLFDNMKELVDLYHDDTFRSYMKSVVDGAFSADMAGPSSATDSPANDDEDGSPAGSLLSKDDIT